MQFAYSVLNFGLVFALDEDARPSYPLCTAALQPVLLLTRMVNRAKIRKKQAMPKHIL